MSNKKLSETAAMRLMNTMGVEAEIDTPDGHDICHAHSAHDRHGARDVQDAHSAHTVRNIHIRQEYKSRRLNLLIQPSVGDRLNKIATMKQTSVNDLINTVLRNYAENEQDVIDKYDKTFL